MDPRVREHAEIIAEHSIDVQPGDEVIVSAPAVAEELVVALYEIFGDIGATPVAATSPLEGRTNPRASRAFMRARGEQVETPNHHLALFEAADAFVIVRSFENATELSDVSPAIQSAVSKANRPIQEVRLKKPWCLTQFPALGNAQLAGMSTEAYENFVWDAILRDWDQQRAHQDHLVEILKGADEVRIMTAETDLQLSIAGNPPLNDYGERNLPGGEVFTAPVVDSVEGEVLFDKPLYHDGREVTEAFLRFEEGTVIDHSATKNEEVLRSVLNTDDGARHLGEIGFGMNRGIDQFTYNMLFDEKMGDTVHLALGNAYADTVGNGNARNQSAVHVDMIVDMSTESLIEVDDEIIQQDGVFVFEDGFESQ